MTPAGTLLTAVFLAKKDYLLTFKISLNPFQTGPLKDLIKKYPVQVTVFMLSAALAKSGH